MLRATRFLLSYLRHPASVVQEEVTFAVEGRDTPATLLHPARGGARTGWIVLHGITVPGRRHPVLMRFAHALASAGGTVLIPEIESWTRLRIDPAIADRSIASAARYLAGHPRAGGEVAVVGFSFGATQALITSTRPELRDVVRTVVGFGGYCDLGRTLRFMMLGEHEWNGRTHHLAPDPYGRWVVAGNYLARVPGMAGTEAVAEAALELAREAGRRFAQAWDPEFEPLKRELRARLSRSEREIWDLLAPAQGVRPPEQETRALADQLLAAALSVHPQMDPRPVLPAVHCRAVLAHGHSDRLIPYTETLRLMSHLGPRAEVSSTITRLFAHSRGAEKIALREYPLEVLRYVRLLERALRG